MARKPKIESTEESLTQKPSPRRTSRKSLPNSDLIIRRQMIQENLKTPDSARKRKQKNEISTKKKKKPETPVQKMKLQKRIKFDDSEDNDIESKIKPAVKCDSTPDAEIKQENDDNDQLKIPDDFIVNKAEDTSHITRDILPTFFPSEDENSGIIVFRNSRRAVLNISFAKCFVVLSGTFSINDEGQFSNGDFFKAPAGSKLGIKYLGGSEECGKIIFFKSVS